jgi:hypothetical protein
MSPATALPIEVARQAKLRMSGRFEFDYVSPEQAVRGVVPEEVWSAHAAWGNLECLALDAAAA